MQRAVLTASTLQLAEPPDRKRLSYLGVQLEGGLQADLPYNTPGPMVEKE